MTSDVVFRVGERVLLTRRFRRKGNWRGALTNSSPVRAGLQTRSLIVQTDPPGGQIPAILSHLGCLS